MARNIFSKLLRCFYVVRSGKKVTRDEKEWRRGLSIKDRATDQVNFLRYFPFLAESDGVTTDYAIMLNR